MITAHDPAFGLLRDFRRVVATHLPTRWGNFRLVAYEQPSLLGSERTEIAVAMVLGEVTGGAPLVRVHSQCLTSEVLGSRRCDCDEQLQLALDRIATEGRGVLIYELQEGRGIGLLAKLEAYALQDRGLDTVQANQALGFGIDCRDFRLPAEILLDLGVREVRLLSNNPHKAQALTQAGLTVVDRVPCEAVPNAYSLPYLRAKLQQLGHLLHLGPSAPTQSHVVATSPFATIDEAVAELRAGRMVVVVDDEDRENEGDLTMVAELVTPEAINFMALHGRGLICLAMTGDRLDTLALPPMVADNNALHGTAFSVSIDANLPGMSTGISAADRAMTIRAAVDPARGPDDFARPGHVFPLRARPDGVLARRGQTEAAVDLAHLAGFAPAGVICEIVKDDGSMARVADLIAFCRTHGLRLVSVDTLVRYRLATPAAAGTWPLPSEFPTAEPQSVAAS